MITGSDCPSTQTQHATNRPSYQCQQLKEICILTHCNYSQPASIKLDNENIGGHCYTFTTEDVHLHTPALRIVTHFLLTLKTVVFLFHLLSTTSKPFSSFSTRLARTRSAFGVLLQKRRYEAIEKVQKRATKLVIPLKSSSLP